ncbi:MAG: gliding motility-associated C-terminal domain-containing protein [Flavobacteriales bacterium]
MVILIGMGFQPLKAQVPPEVVWQRCIGGSDIDYGFGVYQARDGGVITVGYSRSADGDAAGSHGGDDILVTKLNADGTIQWSRALGGSSDDRAFNGLENLDGSIMVVGYTYSSDGDVTANHGGSDVWVVKLSPLGDMIWQHTYGGSDDDLLGQILGTPNGGFLIQASTFSGDGDVVGFHPGSGADNWMFKIDASGILQWSRAIGGSQHEGGGRMILTADGGALVNFSYTASSDGDVQNYHGDGDCLVAKLSAAGVLEWSRTIGGSQREQGSDIVELGNGDIMMLGSTASSDGDVPLNQGGNDVLLVKLDHTGAVIWVRTYGGSSNDDGASIVPTADGGLVLACVSTSSDGDVPSNQGGADEWVFKVDANGTRLWQRCVGGSSSDFGFLIEDVNGGYLLWGVTESNNGEAQGSHGGREFWLVRFSTDGEVRWHACLGGSNDEEIKSVVQTSDSGYVAFGFSHSDDGDVAGNHGQIDMWAVKLKAIEPAPPLECILFIPSAFSPDNSTKNDAHCLYGTDCIATMQLGIYDRWGNKVFASTDPNVCWDGTYNGQPLDPAVFVYHLNATLSNGERVERQGNITLIR